MHGITEVIDQVDALAHKYPVYMLGVAYFVSAVLNGMPAPRENSSVLYIWSFNVASIVGANLSRIGSRGGGQSALR